MSIEIVLWRSEGSETLEGLSMFEFRSSKSDFNDLFIVILHKFEGIDNEVIFNNEELL